MIDRWNVRLPVRMQVVLHLPGRAPIMANSRDVSFQGIYVELMGVAIACNTSLEVELRLPYYGRQEKRHRVPAAVIRAEPRGVALILTNCGPDVLEGLTDLMDIYLSNLVP